MCCAASAITRRIRVLRALAIARGSPRPSEALRRNSRMTDGRKSDHARIRSSITVMYSAGLCPRSDELLRNHVCSYFSENLERDVRGDRAALRRPGLFVREGRPRQPPEVFPVGSSPWPGWARAGHPHRVSWKVPRRSAAWSAESTGPVCPRGPQRSRLDWRTSGPGGEYRCWRRLSYPDGPARL